MPYGTINADIQTDSFGSKLSPSSAVFRNRLINGAMVISQRYGTGAASFTNGTNNYITDRWNIYITQTGKLTSNQSTTAPTGYINSLLVTSSSAYSVLSTDIFVLRQIIEGYNIADLAWGTANAKTVTLSFQVYSSLTGTFGGSISNGTAARSYPFSYTISSANTWTQISVTIPGDTSGTWATDNTAGMYVNFGLGVGTTGSGTAGSWAGSAYYSATGATSVVGTSSATFYLTGVQLEVGTNATNFDYRPYGTELVLCQRYAQVLGGVANQRYGTGWFFSATNGYPFITTTVSLRSPLNVTISYSALSDFVIYSGGTSLTPSAIVADTGSQNGVSILVSVTGATTGYAATLVATGSTSSRLYLLNEL